MNEKKSSRYPVTGMVLLVTVLLAPTAARAHCDGMDGPVVKAAQRALAEGNVNFVLIWVQPADEGTIKTAFQKTLAVRKLSPEAKDLADMYFFETLVRIHRSGEGAPYTGIEPAGRDPGPIIPAADNAIADENAEPLLNLLPAAAQSTIRKHFNEVLAKKHYKENDVQAGREYVEAYVTFMHAAEGHREGDHGDAEGHNHHGKAPVQHDNHKHPRQ